MSRHHAIRTAGAPAPAWAFSQGVRKGPILQVSGQGPQDPATGAYLHEGDVRLSRRFLRQAPGLMPSWRAKTRLRAVPVS